MKRLYILTTILLFSLLLYFGAFIQANEDPISIAGGHKFQEVTMAPDFIAEDLYGNRINLSDFRGKAVMLHFWTTW